MIEIYYRLMLLTSVILVLVFTWLWLKHVDIGYTISFALIPIINMGYLELARATELSTAILANKIVYLGGCFLNIFLMLGVLSLCHIHVSRLFRTLCLVATFVLYWFIMGIGRNEYFYKSVDMEIRNGVAILVKEYGPVHTFFYVMAVFFLVMNIAISVYAYKKRPEVSRDVLNRLLILNSICFVAFFGGRLITKDIELMPLCYCGIQATYLNIFHKLRMYDLSAGVADNLVTESKYGLVSFDMKHRYLACNESAINIIPELSGAYADRRLDRKVEALEVLDKWIEEFSVNPKKNVHNLEIKDMVYEGKIDYLKEDDKTVGYYILLSDVTQEQKYIESMNNYNKQMKEAADAAISAERAKSQFFARMSHEIRTPINAVLGMNEMILRESDDEKTLEYAENIKGAGRTLLAIINDILDFSKIEEGKLELIPVTYDTAASIMNVCNAMEPRAREKGLDFITDIDENLPSKLYGDDVRISQIILNLLSNAIKYTNKGYVKLVIRLIDSFDDTAKIDIRVADTGIGIKDEDKAKLFDSFERFDEDKNRNVEGTGLGMAIVSDLTKMMNTAIKLESVYGKGSVFSFQFDQKIVDKEPIGDMSEGVKSSENRYDKVTFTAPDARVLVVDDDKVNLKVMENFLGLAGIKPDLVESGFDAIDRLKKESYDVVFLDHRMPQMDGIETLQMMKSADILHDKTVVISLTANAGPNAKDSYIEAGFNDYLSKPVEVMELMAKLKQYLPPEKLKSV